jgi:hypothetical protein
LPPSKRRPLGPLDPDRPLDRLEAALERRCRVYRPYRFYRATYDRRRFAADLAAAAGKDGATGTWLARVFARHLEAWRRAAPAKAAAAVAAASPAAPLVNGYFERFLADKTGKRLVPGLASLSAAFTIAVTGAGTFAIEVREGMLVRAGRLEDGAGAARAFGYEVDAASFLAVASGRVRPADLFFRGRVHLRGDLFAALSTATALTEFFARYPYDPEATARRITA